MITTPQEEIQLMRMYTANPSAAVLKIMTMLRSEMREILEVGIQKVKDANTMEIERMILNKIQEVTDQLKKETPNIEKILESVRGKDGEDAKAHEVAGALLQRADFIQMTKAKDGEPGKTPTQEELVVIIKSLIPPPVPGNPGAPGKEAKAEDVAQVLLSNPLFIKATQGTPGEPGIPGKEGSPDTGEEIVTKINVLPIEPKFQIDAAHIKNLPRYKDNKKGKNVLRGGGDIVEYYDLSSQCNGVLKTFTIPTNRKIVWVGGSDAPAGQYRQSTDYTGTGTRTLTLTSEVIAPSQGATLHILYIL